MSARFSFWSKVVLSAIAVISVIFLLTDRRAYESTFISPFFGVTLLTATIIHLRVQRSLVDVSVLVAATVFFTIIDFLFLGFKPLLWGNLSFIGCTSLLVLAVRSIWAVGERRALLLSGLIPASFFVISDRLAPVFLGWTGTIHPKTLDLYLLHFDGSLGFQPSFVAGQLFQRIPVLGAVSWTFYLALPVPLALVYANQLLRKKLSAIPVMVAFTIMGPIGVIFYNLFPATGPVHVFTRFFPLFPPTTSEVAHLLLEPISVSGLRNAIPSLHMAWVVLAWWCARGLSWWSKTIVLTFLIFTFLATLGTGEHYFIDLVVALPFALMVQSIATVRGWADLRQQITPITVGAAGTLSWLALLRFAPGFAWLSPVMPWLLISLTVVVCLSLERRYRGDEIHFESERAAAVPASTTF